MEVSKIVSIFAADSENAGTLARHYYVKTMSKWDVELSQLSIGYAGKRGVSPVASGISGIIREGELTCLLGANGVGKSTLLRTLSAFQPKLSGTITIDGTDIGQMTAKELSRLVGVVLTDKLSLRNMSAAELVALGRAPYTGFWGTNNDEDLRIVDDAIKLVGIEMLRERMIDTLSDGERQKVMIAKALAQQTPVIYLDEPTAFLDFPSKVEVMLLLRHICHHPSPTAQHPASAAHHPVAKTIFLSTHDLELALQVADRIWLMDAIEGLSIGTPDELAQSGKLKRFTERKGIHFDNDTLTIKIDKTA